MTEFWIIWGVGALFTLILLSITVRSILNEFPPNKISRNVNLAYIFLILLVIFWPFSWMWFLIWSFNKHRNQTKKS
jgi:glycopeptide antibiotics resistance protein